MFKKFLIILSLMTISTQLAWAKSELVEGQVSLGCSAEACIAVFQPLKTTLVVTFYKEGKKAKVEKEVQSDDDGNFSLKLKPGIYSFSISPLASGKTPFNNDLKGSDLYITNGSVKVSKGLSTKVFLEALSNQTE